MITYTKIQGKDIVRIVDKMEAAVSGEQTASVMVAAIVVALAIQDPDLTPEQLVEGAKAASEWLATYVNNDLTTVN